MNEKRRRIERALLHARYVCGALATGFLVSVPVGVIQRLGSGVTFAEGLPELSISFSYGLLLLLPFWGLGKLAPFDWKVVRVPEFQMFELTVARTTTFVSGFLGLVSFYGHAVNRFVQPKLFWNVCVLMAFAWGRLELLRWLYPEFYRASPTPPADDAASPS